MTTINVDIGQKPQDYGIADLAADIVNVAPIAEIVQASYGPIWAAMPADDEINAGMAGNVAGKLMQTCIVEPQGTFLEILMATLGTPLPPSRLAECMPAALENLETAITECLKKHSMQGYAYRP